MNGLIILFWCIVVFSVNGILGALEPGIGVCQTIRNHKPRNICCKGYEFVKNTNTCKPRCYRGCDRGTCVRPDVCQCDKPLILHDDGNKCIEPKCDQPCINGVCVDTNTCECENDLYKTINSTHCAYECESGYDHDENLNCNPICNPPCTNGVCIHPDECDCDSGYELNEDETNCVPYCDTGCPNAECIAPNTCQCHEGYTKNNNSTCEPTCDRECLNGYCISPNTCACDPGHVADEIDKFKCIPHCEPGCVNGECKAPDFCSCFNDFEPSIDKWICNPKCERCFNGTCEAPNRCSCNKGYTLVEGLCIPVCEQSCDNGYCSGPGSCTCFDGYEQGNSSWCYRPCESPCIGGTCSQHGICSCKEGYKLENDTCNPEVTTRNNCKTCNGSCIQDDSCYCADGSLCYNTLDEPAEVQSPKMAGLEVTWLVGGAIGVLLLTLVIITIERLWRKKKGQAVTSKPQLSSVLCGAPNTLIRKSIEEEETNGNTRKDEFIMTSIPLLEKTTNNINID